VSSGDNCDEAPEATTPEATEAATATAATAIMVALA
jgi:hypothetical protein